MPRPQHTIRGTVSTNGQTTDLTPTQVRTMIQSDGYNLAGGAGVSDGDKGDVVVASNGTAWTVPDLAGKSNVGHEHTAADVTGLATVATSGSAADLTGTLAAARIADGSLPLAKLESIPGGGVTALQVMTLRAML